MQTLERCVLLWVYIECLVCCVWKLWSWREKIGFASIALFFSALWLMRCVCAAKIVDAMCKLIRRLRILLPLARLPSQFAYLGECEEPAVDAGWRAGWEVRVRERDLISSLGKRWLCISRFLASGHFLLTANYRALQSGPWNAMRNQSKNYSKFKKKI